MPAPSLTPAYALAAITTVVGLFLTQGLIDNRTGQLVTGLAVVIIPAAFAVATAVLKGHQTQAASRIQAAHIAPPAAETPANRAARRAKPAAAAVPPPPPSIKS